MSEKMAPRIDSNNLDGAEVQTCIYAAVQWRMEKKKCR